jgi:hypothetical protein
MCACEVQQRGSRYGRPWSCAYAQARTEKQAATGAMWKPLLGLLRYCMHKTPHAEASHGALHPSGSIMVRCPTCRNSAAASQNRSTRHRVEQGRDVGAASMRPGFRVGPQRLQGQAHGPAAGARRQPVGPSMAVGLQRRRAVLMHGVRDRRSLRPCVAAPVCRSTQCMRQALPLVPCTEIRLVFATPPCTHCARAAPCVWRCVGRTQQAAA